ncbi:MAG: hypothetical protein IPL74_13590 [Bacteroidetes bacterium]|nr:hypothetical protein [Bacteroidota bacterium]
MTGVIRIQIFLFRFTGLSNVIAIAGAAEHTLALLSNNTVWAWGSNSNGQLGNGTTNDSPTPVQVLNLTGIVSIATGLDHSIALKADGTVWAWGFGSYGQIGNGTNNGTNTIAAQATGLNGVTAIEGGYGHSLAVRSNGTVWAWGYNNYGQVGNGNNIDSNIPVQVSNLSGVVKVAGGFIHSLALKSNGTVSAGVTIIMVN